MKRLAGILAMVLILYGILVISNPDAGSLENHQNLARRTGFFGVLTLGAGVLIISGGIDLSIGSVVGLSAVSLALLLERKMNPFLAIALVLAGATLIGLFHGFLVTKLRLQPFVATLCGLFIYRGLAQWATRTPQGSSRSVGIGGRPDLAWLRFWAVDTVSDVPVVGSAIAGVPVIGPAIASVPIIFLLLLTVAGLIALLLHFSVYGRYLYAVGYNEQAAQYAGIPTNRYKVLAYVLCSFLAGLGGILHMLDVETAQPSIAGSWYELYAITGAVLGGCSLRGGQGTVVGIVLGTAVLPMLRNLCIFAGVPSDLEYTVIGVALLLGTITDETLKRRGAVRN